MSDKSRIEWTDATWNPVTGCTRLSPGCENCYIDWAPPFRIEGRHFTEACPECSGLGGFAAIAYAGRVEVAPPCPTCQGTGRVRSHAIGSTTGVRVHPERLDQPLRWKKPRRIFVNSLSDLFHDDVSDAYIARVWAVMALAPQHTFQVLTKRHARMRALLRSLDFMEAVAEGFRAAHPAGPLGSFDEVPALPWPLPNVWLGVTVEDQKHADLRVPYLLTTPAAVRFLSCEPLLGSVDLTRWMPPGRCRWQCGGCRHYFAGEHQEACPNCGRVGYWSGSHTGNGRPNGQPLSWVIVGGESGRDARPMSIDWARSLRDQCQAASIRFLFKQWGDASAWRDRQGDVWHQRNDGGLETPETASFSREHVEKKWGPLVRLGKKAAGRELDGRTWDEYPGASSQAGGVS